MSNDRTLVLLILQGNRPAAGTLLDRYKDRLERRAGAQILRWFNGRVYPGDVMQDFYLKVCGNQFRALTQWQGLIDPFQDSLEPYFVTILKNVIRDKARTANRERFRRSDWDDDRINAIPDPGISLEHSIHEEELRAALWRCIATLSDKLRQVVKLHIEELSQREIAQKLEIDAGACRARLHRAIAALAGCMREAGHNDLHCGNI